MAVVEKFTVATEVAAGVLLIRTVIKVHMCCGTALTNALIFNC